MALYGREHGSKPGSAGVASDQQANIDRRERLRQLALETIDLAKDPYFMKNHLGYRQQPREWLFFALFLPQRSHLTVTGTYECKLCLTLHTNEGSYLAHTQGRRHQQNLARRAAREQRDFTNAPVIPQQQQVPRVAKKKIITVGRPGYKVIKQRDPDTDQLSLLFELHYPEIAETVKPRYRFMSAYEQRVEVPDRNYQYILFAAEPYDTVAFKIPNKEIVKNVGPELVGESPFWTKYDESSKVFKLQLTFKTQPKERTERSKGDYDAMAPKPDRDAGASNPRANYAYFNR